jgi:hypothetical protein
MHKGKEGYPTRVYEVTVSHDTQIRAIAGSFPGTWNDKTVCTFDGIVRRCKKDKRFVEYKYELMNRNGTTTEHHSLWLITDNGYHRWRCLIPPLKISSNRDDRKWSEHLESVRKDAEDTFGRMKKRFRILKIPILYHEVEKVDNVFYTCAILHNMLLNWNGVSLVQLQAEENEPTYGNLEAPATTTIDGGARKAGCHSSGYRKDKLTPGYDGSSTGRGSALIQFYEGTAAHGMSRVEEDRDFGSFRRALIAHYSAWRAQRRHRVWWRRT